MNVIIPFVWEWSMRSTLAWLVLGLKQVCIQAKKEEEAGIYEVTVSPRSESLKRESITVVKVQRMAVSQI